MKGSAVISTWARIEARTYEEALELLHRLTQFPSALVQEGETSWSIYVSAEASEVPRVIYGLGVDPTRISLFDQRPATAPVLDRAVND
jgi:hypothetical protein